MGSSQLESLFQDVLEFNSLFKQKILGAPDEYIDRWDLLNLLYKYNRCHATKYHLILQDPHPADIKWLAQLKQFDMDEATLDVAEPLRVPKNEAEKRDAYMLQEKMQASSSDAGMDYGPPSWLGLEEFEPETQAWLSKHNIEAESPIDEQAIEDAGAKWEHSLNSLELLKNLTVGLLTGYNFQVVDAGAVGNISILDAAQRTVLRAKGKGKQDDTDLNADLFWQKPAPGGDVEVVELILHLLQCYTKETQRMEIETDQDLVEAARRVITCAERTSEATDEDKSSLVKALQEVVNEQSKLFETCSDLSFFELLRGISEKSGIALGCLVRHVVGLIQRTERIELRTHQALQQAATNFIAHAEGKPETREPRERYLVFMRLLQFALHEGMLPSDLEVDGEGFSNAAETKSYDKLRGVLLKVAKQIVEQSKAEEASSSKCIHDSQAQRHGQDETIAGAVRSKVVEDVEQGSVKNCTYERQRHPEREP